MADRLEDCRAKVHRADEHIHAIYEEIGRDAVQVPADTLRSEYRLQDGADVGQGFNEVVYFFQGDIPPLPRVFSLLAGEAVYQLRSALDHLVYQLILQQTNQPPTFNSAFPVVTGGRMVKGKWRTAGDVFVAQTAALKQVVSGSALALLHQMQPYHRGPAYVESPLAQITELNNIDKHRLLILTVHGVSEYHVDLTSRGKTVSRLFTPAIRLEDGAEIGRMPLHNPPFDKAEVDVKGKLVVNVAFGDVFGTKNVPALPRLRLLSASVARVLDHFASEFC